MKLLSLLLVAAALALATATVIPTPGLCGVNSQGELVGELGCSFDRAVLEPDYIDVKPKKQVVDFNWCPEKCFSDECWYTVCDNVNCMKCHEMVPWSNDYIYSVPQDVAFLPTPGGQQCSDLKNFSTVQNYVQENVDAHSSSGFLGFHSSSSFTEKFYQQYYLQDSSAAYLKNYFYFFELGLDLFAAQPTQEFTAAMNALPEVYDEQAYLDFIDTWGTHFVSKGRMGGISLATYFFHSCFLETSTLYVHQQTSGWGWGLFHHGDSGGDKHLDCMWEKWSTQQGALLGGNATAYAPGGVFPKGMSLTSDQYWAWANSTANSPATLHYELQNLTFFMNSNAKVNNFNQAVQAHYAAIGKLNQAKVDSLKPHDPWCKPDWCNFSPHPSFSSSLRGANGGNCTAYNPNPSCPDHPVEPSPSFLRSDVLLGECPPL